MASGDEFFYEESAELESQLDSFGEVLDQIRKHQYDMTTEERRRLRLILQGFSQILAIAIDSGCLDHPGPMKLDGE